MIEVEKKYTIWGYDELKIYNKRYFHLIKITERTKKIWLGSFGSEISAWSGHK